MTLERMIPLPEAARKLGLSESRLRRMAEQGKITAGQLPNGEIVVSENNTRQSTINEQLQAINPKHFAHLAGQEISVTEAADKYSREFLMPLLKHTILLWVRQGHIKVLKPSTGRGSRMLLDEADVAYCAKIHTTRQHAGVHSGVPLLDKQGLPYLLKHPELSRARRESRQNG
jgi:hypothetical protein